MVETFKSTDLEIVHRSVEWHAADMSATKTARERARDELTATIKDAARRHLVEAGADELSLRAVARELGMASSAVYRYFSSRDQLLTALIVDAYNALGAATEAATNRAGTPAERWHAGCTAVREWARAHPQEYALLYGSPVPGYAAPQDTVDPAARPAVALLACVRDAWAAGTVLAGGEPELPAMLDGQLEGLAEALGLALPNPVLARAMIAWTQLFGMVSFELFGHLKGSVDPASEFFGYTVEQMAEFIGFS